MNQLHKDFASDGLEIIALPSDQFGGQELAVNVPVRPVI